MTDLDVAESPPVEDSEPVWPPVRVLGVRHHGPGSARAVRAALEAYAPDVVLVEGPPEADALVSLVGDTGMEPPVALLAYAADDPGKASFWPMAAFSPEWQALRWAVENHREVRFMDLPAATMLALRDEDGSSTRPQAASLGERSPCERQRDEEPDDDADDSSSRPQAASLGEREVGSVRGDPIAVLAHAAGYDDPERWWDDVIEHRFDGDPFDAVAEAMEALREAAVRERSADDEELEQRREAHMRKVLRAAQKDGHARIAVVCGAWHVPALTGKLPTQADDNRVLRGLPKRKVTMTWVPWTHSRLSFRSGYGAGVDSPGWYHHLFTQPDDTIVRWLTGVARVLRGHDLPVSSAHVIEGVRLAETLAGLRNRPLAGLDEVMQATLATMCDGNPVALELVTRDAVVGERLGTVPDAAPAVPLDRDLRATAKTLRLPLSAEAKELTLDLRKPNERARSQLLQRLRVLGIGWGEEVDAGGLGTFKEGWDITWAPELSVRVIEASVWGTTVEAAATSKLLTRTETLAAVTGAVAEALRADLVDALPDLLVALEARAAADHDVVHLMEAFPALVRAQRYGDVRGTDASALAGVTEALLLRICTGLPPVAGGLDDDAAAVLVDHLEQVDAVLPLLADDRARERWLATLGELADRHDVRGLLAGRLVRLLLGAERLTPTEAARRLSLALSHGTTAAEKAGWVEGLLAGGALLLVHDPTLLEVIDAWLVELAADEFPTVVAMLRRTFGAFEPAERRTLADRVRRLGSGTLRSTGDDELDLALAADALATVGRLIGGFHDHAR
ncbi:DUF5682 family protein [Mariniluteicoccus flavus]